MGNAGTELWVTGGTVVTMNPAFEVIPDGVVQVSDGRIAAVGKAGALQPPPGAEILDATGGLVTPGLINGHTHSPMALFRGIADDLPLKEWLEGRIFPLEQKWGSDAYALAGTRLAAIEMVRSGTTTFNDMYFFADKVAEAAHEAGMRALCGQTIVEVSDIDQSARDYLKKMDRFREILADYPLSEPVLAPHSLYTVSRASWERIIAYAVDHGLLIHTHLSETQREVDECLERFGQRPVHYFAELGLWDLDRVLAAHSVCLDASEIEVLGRHGVGVAHNIESNLKLGTEIAPVAELRQAGAFVALGTDSVASNNDLDLLAEADTAAKLQSYRLGPGKVTARDVFACLTRDGARALGLQEEIGSLEVGKAADLIVVDCRAAHLTPLYDPFSHLVYSAAASDVRHTMVAGRVLMKDRRLLRVDETAVLEEAREWGRRIAAELS